MYEFILKELPQRIEVLLQALQKPSTGSAEIDQEGVARSKRIDYLLEWIKQVESNIMSRFTTMSDSQELSQQIKTYQVSKFYFEITY